MSPVDRLYEEAKSLHERLHDLNEISLQNSADDCFRKALLIAAASYFETRLSDSLILYVDSFSGNSQIIRSILRNKAIERQYHSWFDWKGNNANKFFALFGEDFKNHMQNKINNSIKLQDSIKSFMEIGRERNLLVHSNYANFSLEKTLEEIYELYKNALIFVNLFPDVFYYR